MALQTETRLRALIDRYLADRLQAAQFFAEVLALFAAGAPVDPELVALIGPMVHGVERSPWHYDVTLNLRADGEYEFLRGEPFRNRLAGVQTFSLTLGATETTVWTTRPGWTRADVVRCATEWLARPDKHVSRRHIREIG